MAAKAFLLALLFATGAQAAPPADPLGSPNWTALAQTFFGDDPVRFDPLLIVHFPAIAENQRQFPVQVDARALGQVKRILIFADLNPIPLAIDFAPGPHARPFIATRIKLDQRTPVRAAAQLADGSWAAAGGWIDAAGGGCSAPPVSRVRGDWAQHLGEVRGRAIATDGVARVQLSFRHPMDTGFVANIPTYNLETVTLSDRDGNEYGIVSLEASVSEDPALTLLVDAAPGSVVAVTGRDTSGIEYDARLPVTAASPSTSTPVGAARP
ncbi:quinoprotein dehydrogenase-associated SoxYZ-like carrier [Sphingomonas sp. AP4-R1]|uniref:quinoprotein dehydrogenase-associated SoxYZ-like carrier n=1 Tax=Sphingomonas sp. AP4-R1 TaxID=2735134 RepID=UPI0014934DF8|nr:quinoprotein dehydrogenase-associated SoxYZ-like carrier [Sphingomonas sp. AP4-R1]QJU60110.1 quinoprotein dehydrogenase-associated SoxYZ-like carrier [Sphingomonas sp. AP4-R1]